MVCTAMVKIAMVKEYTLLPGQKLNPQRNPHTMDDQKLFNHMADEHGLLLLESQMREIIDIVLEMHNEKPETCTINKSTTFYSKLQMADILRGIKESQKYGTKYIYLRKDYDVIGYLNPLTDKECEAIGAEFMFKLQTIK